MWRAIKEVFWLAVAVAIVAGGWFGFQFLAENRTVVEAAPIERSVPTVEAAPLQAANGIPIAADGFISASRLLDIAGETGGRIVELHPAIDARGAFEKGDILFRLDDRNARANLAQVVATIESSTAQLNLVITQLERAYELRDGGIIAQDQLDQLLSREQELEASLRSLYANREAAEIALANTVVEAPFDGRVLSKQAELGAVIAQGAPVAQIYSADALEVTVDIREREAALIANLFSNPTARASVETEFAGQDYQWSAQIARVDRQIDAQTRTLSVTLALDDPAAGKPASGGAGPALPALINAFVSVEIQADVPDDTFVVDVTAVRNDEAVWILDGGSLRVEPITVLHRAGDKAFITGPNLAATAMLVTSPLSSVSDGMTVSAASPPPATVQVGG
ncbi:MAG: efflux RND transporter periplasmic adaptor subunit [Pseudomonadota bacterium]